MPVSTDALRVDAEWVVEYVGVIGVCVEKKYKADTEDRLVLSKVEANHRMVGQGGGTFVQRSISKILYTLLGQDPDNLPIL